MASKRRKRADDRPTTIPDAELQVLKALWAGGPGTVRELLERLETSAAYTTVQTLVSRLVDKGHVRADRRGTAHVFAALTMRQDLAERRVDEVADALLDGATAPLVLRLVEKGKFSPDDLASFRKLLKDAERRGQDGENRS
ncbi:MAG: BlaI/MecI/CopY family transcriptional regulator [Planctomycetota bacterium]